MLRGKVKWFNDAKGYGFIEGPEGQDLFVHWSEINMVGHKTLSNNQIVEYVLREGDKGPHAISVNPVAEVSSHVPA